MKIYLYLANTIVNFSLPKRIMGSFSFDENFDEEYKLINIEAKEGKWYIYSTMYSQVLSGDSSISQLELVKNSFYFLTRDNKKYIIYVTDLFDDTFYPYKYNETFNINVGKSDKNNFCYKLPFIDDNICSINKKDGQLLIKVTGHGVYRNSVLLTPQENNYVLKSGDQIHIYGLSIMLFDYFIMFNNPNNLLTCNINDCKISSYQLSGNTSPADIEFQDIELYEPKDYYNKAPRIRRLIKTKEMSMTPPPAREKQQDSPALLTLGPMLTMAVTSVITFLNTISKVLSGSQTFQESISTLVTAGAMLLSSLVWPTLTKIFSKYVAFKKNRDVTRKYNMYLKRKAKEFEEEANLQKEILIENLLPVDECLKVIDNGKFNFWDKRLDQEDLLVVRIGKGNAPLKVKVNFGGEDFALEEDLLKKKAEELVAKYKYIPDVPIEYSLCETPITAFMGDRIKCIGLVNNIILQLITYYSYDDVKIVILTNTADEGNWSYAKYLNHCFSNNKQIRFFSNNQDSARAVTDYLSMEFQRRYEMSQNEGFPKKPYYIIVSDDYEQVKRFDFIKNLTNTEFDLGFSLLIIEDKLSRLPSKCKNFINMGPTVSGLMKNSFESQEQIVFNDEINYNIDMMSVARKISNIPIEMEESAKALPESLTFLEMEKIGKVEQLNIVNRWEQNDSTQSLRAEVGVDPEGSLMYLDLHEKFHGPHGLIAGMTGSGKSEFIITYILSMAMNYSPDDVAFILIDYKGGGLAGAFENKTTGVSLPHLAGTITNLDKAEMNRTLVSIDSEVKRRQAVFNSARDALGESTIDIYKYQRFYKEGKLEEPVPHLFIICDEFAELKSQQPDFMDNLISVARIGRSLGVHLILATQKPSGVVNDQIWSNTKFRVCLKVQDESDSKEMLKRPEAASLKQTGRFYLQVGFDEYFALGQSGWCGAKYYPSDTIIKQVDKSINFIDTNGNIIKSIQAGNNIKIEPQGEQLAAILKSIIEASKQLNIRTKRLWLNNIDPIITNEYLTGKYEVNRNDGAWDVKAILGEYDAPEMQEQGLLEYSIHDDGNTIIYGVNDSEKEMMLNSLLYSMLTQYSSKMLNVYIIDYGSEQLRMFEQFPQVGGMVFTDEKEPFNNLFKMLSEESDRRKKLLIPFGGSLDEYNRRNEEKLPYIMVIMNNYENISEGYADLADFLAPITRDCERYGIIFVITCTSGNAVTRKVNQSFNNKYCLQLSDPSDYGFILNVKPKSNPPEIQGRGICVNNGVAHEFQTASIVNEDQSVVEFVNGIKDKVLETFKERAPKIPSLPDVVDNTYIDLENKADKFPVGIARDSLKVMKLNLTENLINMVASSNIKNLTSFTDSMVDVANTLSGYGVIFIDADKSMEFIREKDTETKKINYYDNDLSNVIDKLIAFNENEANKKFKFIWFIHGMAKLNGLVEGSKLESLFDILKKNGNSTVIAIDSEKGFKTMDMEMWFTRSRSNSDGVWIGKGFGDQSTFRINRMTKEFNEKFKNNYGFMVKEGDATIMKVIEFNPNINKEAENEE